MENFTSTSEPVIVPEETKAQPGAGSTNGPLGVPVVKVTDDQQLTSETTSRDCSETSCVIEDDSSVTSSSCDESNQSKRPQRPSKAERILGLTSQDFEWASIEARRRQGTPGPPRPPSNLELRPITPIFKSPRTARRQGEGRSSPSSPHDQTRKQFASHKPSGRSCWGLLSPSERRGFGPTASLSSTDLKQIGNGSEADSDADLSSVGDDGSSTSSTSFNPKKSSEHRGRDRLKKILRPASRSKSAGAGERAPAYALFLLYQHDNKPPMVKSTDNVTRNSTDCTESEEEEEEPTDATPSGKLPARSKRKKERFTFFRRPESHSGHSSSGAAVLPSLETIQGWTKSFEKLLTDKYGVELFRQFLRQEFSEENVEFWIECEKYRQLSSEKHRITESKKIFHEFVAVQAPSEINLDSKTREATELNLGRADPRLFEPAQKRIEALMEKDSYPRFLQSEPFQRLLQQKQAADNSLRVT